MKILFYQGISRVKEKQHLWQNRKTAMTFRPQNVIEKGLCEPRETLNVEESHSNRSKALW